MHTTRKAFSHPRTKAFTLIEVVIFIAISSIILITIVSLSVNVIRQTAISHHKLYATRYADELAEWLRIQKEVSWQEFYTMSQLLPTPNTIYCLNSDILLTSTLSSMPSPGDCTVYDGIRAPNPGPKLYKRSISFPLQTNNRLSVKGTIRVEWREANNSLYFVQVETLFAPR